MDAHPFVFNSRLFNVITDAAIADIRERAKNGNFDSMVLMGTYIQKGMYTPKNPDLALQIFDYVINHKTAIPFPDTYCKALCQKSHLHALRDENEQVDETALELVRYIVQLPPHEWDHEKLESATEWLRDRCEQQSLFT